MITYESFIVDESCRPGLFMISLNSTGKQPETEESISSIKN